MSAFGDDCHFYYNSTCVKGASCPFRHSEAAKTSDTTCTFWQQKRCSKPYCTYRHAELMKNRGEIACYWENQPVGCAKANCPFKHFKPRPTTVVFGTDETSQSSLKSDSGDLKRPDLQNQAEEQQIVQSDQVIVHPVIVNIAEDSDVEMTSPVKQQQLQERGPLILSTEHQQHIKPVKVVKKKILHDNPAKLFKPVKTVQNTQGQKPEQNTTVNVVRKTANTQVVKMRPVVSEEKLPVKQRIQKPSVETEPRLSVKDRLNKGVEAVKKPSVKERLQLGVGSPQRLSVKDRLQLQNNQGYSSDEGRKPVHQRISRSCASDTQTSESEGEGVEVKSLEQIQREKALRSMGLMELKDGTIVKISESEKKTGETKEADGPADSSDEEDQTAYSESEEDEEQEVDEEVDEEENNEDKDSEEEDDEEEVEEEEEEVEEEELVEPDIDIMEPEKTEEIQDIRQALPKESIPQNDTKKVLKKNVSPITMDAHSKVKKKRNVIIEDDDATPVLKESIRSRLGKRINVDEGIVISVGNTPQGTLKRRLGLKEPIGSTNQGTVKTVAGIKSRLGWTSDNVQPDLDHEDDERPKEDEEASSSPASKHRGWRKPKMADAEGEGLTKPEGGARKRRWRKTEKGGEGGNEDETSSNASSSRPTTPVEEDDGEDPTKKRRTEDAKKEEDPGAKVQNVITQRWRKLGVWSSRNPDNQPAKRNEELEKLGIGIIDLQGGKVVKMGKKEIACQETTAGKDGDEWVKESMKRLAARREARKERAIYVPPALKRSGSASSNLASSPPKRRATENEVDSDNESKEEPEVKTFAQIMAAKRQRQKRAEEKEKESKKLKKITGLMEENSNDSTDMPAEDVDHHKKAKKEHSKSEHKKHRSKKVSKWRRKSKSKTEEAEKTEGSNETEHVSEKENANVDNEIIDSSILGDGEKVPVASDMDDIKKTVSLDHMDAGSKLEATDLKTGNQDDAENSSPTKRAEHLLSDSWLEFDSEDLGVEDKDDDDLLKEIDELLA